MRDMMYGPNGEQAIFTCVEDIPKGWRDHPFKKGTTDHDGDGKMGGSTSSVADLKALRAEYRAKLGKKPFPSWGEAELRRRMA